MQRAAEDDRRPAARHRERLHMRAARGKLSCVGSFVHVFLFLLRLRSKTKRLFLRAPAPHHRSPPQALPPVLAACALAAVLWTTRVRALPPVARRLGEGACLRMLCDLRCAAAPSFFAAAAAAR